MKRQYIFMNLIAPAFVLLPVVTAFVRYYLLTKPAKILLVYLITDLLVSAASSTLAYCHLPNTPLYHVATIVQTLIMLYFFTTIFLQKNVLIFLRWSIFVFPLIGIINTCFVQPLMEFNSYTLSLQALLVMICCFLYWWHKNDEELAWSAIPLNWIISGLLFYFSSSFLLFTFSNVALAYLSVKNFILIWNIHAALSILMYIFISIGFSRYKK